MESIGHPSHFHITTLWHEDGEYGRDVHPDHRRVLHLERTGDQSLPLAKTAPSDSRSRHTGFLTDDMFHGVLFHTRSTGVAAAALCKRGHPSV